MAADEQLNRKMASARAVLMARTQGRLRRFLLRLLGGWSVDEAQLLAVRSLGLHILERLAELPAFASTTVYEDWLMAEFIGPLEALMWGTARSRRAHFLMSLLVVAGGFATSGIAVAAGSGGRGSSTSWIVFSIGLVLAILGGANQLFQPGARATARSHLAVALRLEGWAFAMRLAPYADATVEDFGLFQGKVATAQRQVAQIGEIAPPPPPAGHKGNG